ncbi:UDP-galactopyranose mutase [Desulfobacula sp.]|uniref:UDP-galactopyranose mutase n=1 Tax=Desulfobacula sp. TaxID=2593537 RepID=UPI00263196B8|nr:UDP-galactopyranose mutase [Desulfobacula sp.]
MKSFDVLIIGAGITGITAASILAREKNLRVLIDEKRTHIGGNCYDCINKDGLLIHLYGPHIFHTQHKSVWDYLSQFTNWIDYIHHVKAFVDKKHISFPININTFEQLFNKTFTRNDVISYLEKEKIDLLKIENAEDMVISRMGKTIYNKFFKNYTRKQWGMDARQLAPEITARIPIRFNRDDTFFTDPYQGIPENGYTAMFKRMLDHPNIKLITGKTFQDIQKTINFKALIFTGPIDEFFNYQNGALPYRGIHFDFKTYDQEYYLPVAVVNYPNDHEYTRATEFKHMTQQKHPKTSLCYEYPADSGSDQVSPLPSYPILTPESICRYKAYQDAAHQLTDTLFMGRLGKFQYLNMDICVKQVMDELNAF